ncbi:MAG: SDR family oxidoreductase [Candidatus Omnitrophica bacterium]|nr:SDR family oxidoreductase [Candidatus Omnitrophota bacterium]
MKRFEGKTALITGASRGIGRAIAELLSREGAHIVLNFVRNEEAACKTEKALTNNGARVLKIQANVGNPKEAQTLVEEAGKAFGKIDILVHNAALGAFKPVSELRVNQWDLSLDVNTKALLVLAQSALPWMEKEGGSIITLSSLGSKRYIPNYGAIGISKAALEALVRYLAVELAPKKIRVNAVSGGLVDTDAIQSFPHIDNLKKEVVRRTPANRIGKPEDLAKVVAFLASEEAAWIYGQTITADGGLSLI